MTNKILTRFFGQLNFSQTCQTIISLIFILLLLLFLLRWLVLRYSWSKVMTLHHPTSDKVNSSCCKFVYTLIGQKHLSESFKSTRSSPRFFDSLDMLGFGDGRAETIWCTK